MANLDSYLTFAPGGAAAFAVHQETACVRDAERMSARVLAGGSTLFPGFGERLLKELRSDLPDHTKIKIHAPPERMLSTWIGGSILASLATFKSMWVLRAEFEEHGARLFSQRAL